MSSCARALTHALKDAASDAISKHEHTCIKYSRLRDRPFFRRAEIEIEIKIEFENESESLRMRELERERESLKVCESLRV
eukprot:6194188-Pleurochrysis_carterae.AAC.13